MFFYYIYYIFIYIYWSHLYIVCVRIPARDPEHGSERGKVVHSQSDPVHTEDKSKCSAFHI